MSFNYNTIIDHKFVKLNENRYIAVVRGKDAANGAEKWYTIKWDEVKTTSASALKNKIVLTKEEIMDIAEQFEKFQEENMYTGRGIYKDRHNKGEYEGFYRRRKKFRQGELRNFFKRGIRQALTPEEYEKLGVPVSLRISVDMCYGKTKDREKIEKKNIKLEHPVYLAKTIEKLLENTKKTIPECITDQGFEFNAIFPDKLTPDYIKEKKEEIQQKREKIKAKIKQLSLI